MNPEERARSFREFTGSVVAVRAVEDCIRATGKYSKFQITETKVLGADFPSKVLTEHYEVYPKLSTKFGGDVRFPEAVDLFIGESPTVIVKFKYNYREDTASVIIKKGIPDIQLLIRGIDGFEASITKLISGGIEWVNNTAETTSVGSQNAIKESVRQSSPA